MPSTKVQRGRLAALPRKSGRAKAFEKDWRRLQHSGVNLAPLKEAMSLLVANDGPLSPEWKDHALQGNWADHRECHAGGDLLLVYRLEDDGQEVIFARAGSHS